MKKLLGILLTAICVVGLASCDQLVPTPTDSYTYNTAMSVFPTNWNPHVYQTATDSTVLDYTTSGFYGFDYNETKDGYSIVPVMAKSEPVDVTKDFVGDKWGIADGETGRAYTIDLRDNIEWETGEKITAQDFVDSAKLLLNPVAANYRADQLYSGNLVVVNAKNYLYQGSHAYQTPMVSAAYGDDEYVDPATFTVAEDGTYYIGDVTANKDMAVDINDGGNWGSELALYADYGYFVVTDAEGKPVQDEEGNLVNIDAWNNLAAAADADGIVVLTTTTLPYLQDCIAWLHGFENAAAYAAALEAKGSDPAYAYKEWEEMAYYGSDFESVDFADVGLFASGEYQLTIILEKKLTGFYLLYSLGGGWLVHEDTYKKCESVDANGLYTNTYGTSVDTYKSYGPYKLTAFQKDKEIKFTRNDNYFEYDDESEVPLYQTTDINIQYVKEDATRLELFNKGELDAYGLTANDMEKYSSSDHIYYQTGASTFYLAINPGDQVYADWDADAANAGYSKQIINVKEFRMALSFALDRASFALATAPTNSAAIAMFSDLIISDPENGVAYRTTEEAKDVVLNFWGLADQVGEGKKYATKDEAIDSITGYDPEGAKVLFDQAYDYAIDNGLMKETDKVKICIGLASASSNFYIKGYEYLVNCWTKAVEGTKLEGKLEFVKNDTIGNDFADRLRDNTVDMLFGVGWTGAALDPYSLISAYTDPNYQYDPNTDTKAINVDVVIDGQTLRMSLYDWTMSVLIGEAKDAAVIGEDGKQVVEEVDGNIVGKTVSIAAGTDAENSTRLAIFAACENALLQLYNLIPLIDDASASLKGMQITYYTEDYIYGVGRGGIKYMTYTMTDAEWAKYVADNGGTLNYE